MAWRMAGASQRMASVAVMRASGKPGAFMVAAWWSTPADGVTRANLSMASGGEGRPHRSGSRQRTILRLGMRRLGAISGGKWRRMTVCLSTRATTLNDQEKARVRAGHVVMDPLDEPPYPLHGAGPMFRKLQSSSGRMRLVGSIDLVVLVDSAGKGAKSKSTARPIRRSVNLSDSS